MTDTDMDRFWATQQMEKSRSGMKFAIHIMLLALTPCIAQVTGTLINSSNQPISGCAVKMGQESAVSDANGAFVINSVTAIVPLFSEPKWKFLDNTITFTLPETKRFGFEIFNVRGNKVVEFEPRLLSPGNYSIKPFLQSGTDLSSSQYIVCFSSGPETLRSSALKKAAAALDFLQINCNGYPLLKVPVASNNAKLGNIIVSKSDTTLPGIHVDYNPYSNMSNNW